MPTARDVSDIWYSCRPEAGFLRKNEKRMLIYLNIYYSYFSKMEKCRSAHRLVLQFTYVLLKNYLIFWDI